MIHVESMAEYQARKAVSAGFLWKMVNECPAQAWYESCFNPEVTPLFQNEAALRMQKPFDIGTAAHWAVQDLALFDSQITVIDAANYRTKAAREAQLETYIAGKTPLLPEQRDLVLDLRAAIKQSEAAELFFGVGQSEVSYTWEWEGVACKARVDRIAGGRHLVDLKTAVTASPSAFQRAMIRDGHHLRAAWYLDGWRAAEEEAANEIGSSMVEIQDYVFVVVAKTPPHLVSIFRLDERALSWGRKLYRSALDGLKEFSASGVWPGYTIEGQGPAIIGLPTWAEYQYADGEAEGLL